MIKKAKQAIQNSTLATKIRYSYALIIIPMFIFILICFFNIWQGNARYAQMINSAVVASEFSLDFKQDFDYETYLLIVGNKSLDESELDSLLLTQNVSWTAWSH